MNTIVLDVFIGLIFIYLLYSLLATVLQEIIATNLSFRAKILQRAITRMLEDERGAEKKGRTGGNAEGAAANRINPSVETERKNTDEEARTTDLDAGAQSPAKIEGKKAEVNRRITKFLKVKVLPVIHIIGKRQKKFWSWFLYRIWDRFLNFYNLLFIKNIPEKTFTFEFYDHPLIKFLAEDSWNSKPSYINRENFSKVVIDLLRGYAVEPGQNYAKQIAASLDSGKPAGQPFEICPQTLKYLKSLWIDSQADIDKFNTDLQLWFDYTMARASGWYKRYVQILLFIIGLILATSFRVDTIAISQKLSRDPKLREQMVRSASIYLEKQKGINPNTLSVEQKKLDNTMAISTSTLVKEALNLSMRDIADTNEVLNVKTSNAFTPLGCLITAIAISFGAPFWFDLLNKFMSLRGSFKDPSKTPDPIPDTKKPVG
jgi:hypothetical protein